MNGIVNAPARSAYQASLVRTYVDELERIVPTGPLQIGGNCQSGRIATEIALEVARRGREVARLCLLDFTPEQELPFKVSLIFGRDSLRHNPFLKEDAPQLVWQKRFASVTWDIVPGRHGQFFRPGRIEELSATIERRLTYEHETPRDRSDDVVASTG